MMLPTHALWGMVLALPVALLLPEFGGVALVAGFLGGLAPDLDMYVGHRKTLHYPVFYSAGGLAAAVGASFVQTWVTVGLAVFVLGAAVHSVSDVLGGGLELRPWERTSDRAVYDHYRGQWIAPRYWIRYDGSPEDLLLSAAFAAPLLVTLDGPLFWLVVASLGVGAVYATVRRVLPAVAVGVVETVLAGTAPPSLLERLPERYVPDSATGLATDAVDVGRRGK